MSALRRKESLLASANFTPHEKDIIGRILEAVDEKAASFEKKGLSKRNFCLGVTNSLFVAWAFGAIPQHFWIVYLLEILILFPMRWHNMVSSTPKQHFYWLDFCWVVNIVTLLALAYLAVDTYIGEVMSERVREILFSAFWGIGCGPLFLAVGLLNNALVFHDADNTASVLIHLFPSLVLFCFRWRSEAVTAAWPHIFRLDYFATINIWTDIYYNAAMAYTIWWALYTVWLLTMGMKLPAKGFDTIFHYNMRAGFGDLMAKATKQPEAELKRRRKENDFLVRDALLYMLGHALSVYIGILFSLLCYSSMWFHGLMCGVLSFITIYNGSSRYTFYLLRVYTRLVRTEVEKLGHADEV